MYPGWGWASALRIMASLPLIGSEAFILLLFYFQVAFSAKFSVIGPDQPIRAPFGADIMLWCMLSPAMDASHMEIRWFRSQYYSPVHLYREGKDENDQQLLEYQGRTELIKDGIQNGSVSLRISSVRLSDEGQYKCFFEDKPYYDEAILDMNVIGSGSPVHFHLDQQQDGGVRVVCLSTGLYPEPKVFWSGEEGQNISSAFRVQKRENSGLYSVEDVVIIMQPAGRKIDCSIHTSLLDQPKVATLSIGDAFFPKASQWMVAFAFLLTIFVLFTFGVWWYIRKQHREKDVLSSQLGVLTAEVDLRRTIMNPDYVLLDERTANPSLSITPDRRCVRHADGQQRLEDSSARFDTETCVLGVQRFTQGRHYWKVDVGDGREWAVGVCKDSVRKSGAYQFSPQEGIWSLALFVDSYVVLDSKEITLSQPGELRQIGVYLQCEAGELSFYNADSMELVHTFSKCFFNGETIRPFFWLGNTGIEISMCH
ncbi:hypothetical protein NDU88_001323 [Pleurodeles waltl]|uniref:Butyrophilin subfamily 1 member A1-like n=1 Tax=Pleurodeles waltl TaxID=8319 RepID=A0AAV7Q2T3_PLEWA|nr:hypothetical protein NDU88_001323 [Pleurodeles waltl]